MTFHRPEEIIEDDEKGASELLEGVIASIERLEEKDIKDYLEKLVRKRYTMTPLVNLANNVFISMDKGRDIEREIQALKYSFLSLRAEAAEEMKRVLREKGKKKVLTLSRSSTVLQILSEVEKAVVLESRPMKEGRKVAEYLSGKGVNVEYWIDAGLCKALKNVDCAVIGADSISTDGFLNKIGSRPLAVISEEVGKDLYVVADSSKILPRGIPVPESESHPPEEVWDTSAKIDVKNDYFELTELEKARYITEEGVKTPVEIKKTAEEKGVSERLLEIHPLVREK
ncbi:MAG: hypothetical protein ACLFU5_04190 [Thermoplasmata archaeon]